MDRKHDETHYNLKGLLKYISTVVSWTLFVILVIVGVLLVYYYVSLKLYQTKGERFEPKFSVYTIVSQSMEPTINVFDVIINTKVDDPKDIKINDVITFISTWQVTYGMTITHRVVGTKTLDDGSLCYITRGDNNTQDDQACVKESNVIGVVKAVIPGLGNIQFFLSSRMGWLLLIILPALYIIVKDILKIIKMANTIDDEEDSNKNKKDKKKELEDDKDKELKIDIDEEDTKKVNVVKKEIKIRDEISKDDIPKFKEDDLEKAYHDLKKIKDKKSK